MAVWFRPRDMNRLKISALTFDEFHDSGIEPARFVLVPEYYLHGPRLEAAAQQRTSRQGTANSLAPAHSASGSRFSTQLRRERHGIHRIDKNAEHQRPWRLYCLNSPAAARSNGATYNPGTFRFLLEPGPQRNPAYHGQGAQTGSLGRHESFRIGIPAPS